MGTFQVKLFTMLGTGVGGTDPPCHADLAFLPPRPKPLELWGSHCHLRAPFSLFYPTVTSWQGGGGGETGWSNSLLGGMWESS